MATISKAYEALVLSFLGYVPTGLTTLISPLSADERDRFTLAWLHASQDQRQQPSPMWVLPEADRAKFDTFRIGMNGLSV